MSPKPWTCPNGHVLGLAKAGNAGQQLLLYRQALDLAPGADQVDVDVIAMIGSATEIRCSVCGAIRSWFQDPESLRRMVRKFKKEGMGA